MAAEHAWLEGLGLEKTRDGRWRHSNGLFVTINEDEYNFAAHILGRRVCVCAHTDIVTEKMTDATVEWSSIGAVPAAGARTMAAALTLAADIADAYNKWREG